MILPESIKDYLRNNKNNPSIVKFFTREVRPSTDISQFTDRDFTTIIRVHGLEKEDVEIALEELMTLWADTTRFDALRTNSNLINIQAETNYFPQQATGKTASPIFGEVEYLTTVRYIVP